jgi:hypothetical protein
MQTINVFWYKNILEIQWLDPAIFSTRNRIVYSRTVKIYQGIDNPIHIVVKNQDQKSVNTTGYLLQLDIQDPEIEGAVASFAVETVDAAKGLAVTTIDKDTVNALDKRFYYITVKRIDQATNAESPNYIDDNYSVSLPLEVLPGWYENNRVTALPDEIIDGGQIQ